MANNNLLESTGRLTEAVEGLSDKVDEFARKDRTRRWQLIGLAVSVALDLLLSAGFFYALHGTNDAQQRTDALVQQVQHQNSALKAACEATNETGKKERQLWQGVLSLPKDPKAPPTDPKQVEAFFALIDQTFPLRDCSKI